MYSFDFEHGTVTVRPPSLPCDPTETDRREQGHGSPCSICRGFYNPDKCTAQRWCFQCAAWCHEVCIAAIKARKMDRNEVWKIKCAAAGYDGGGTTFRTLALQPARRRGRMGIQEGALLTMQVLEAMSQSSDGRQLSAERKGWLRWRYQKCKNDDARPATFFSCPYCASPI